MSGVMMKRVHSKQGGFTLIEIAIVLVIIGLLLGGVLKGQELINTARVRSLNNTVDGITAAWFSFQDRYRAFPGDYLQAKAIVNLPGVTVGGNGNGRVGVGAAGADDPAERGQVWVHLEAAGYMSGGYDGADINPGTEYTCPVTGCPDNGFGTGMSIFHGSEFSSTTGNAHELMTGQGIPVEVIAELDRKIDDDSPLTGVMQLGDPTGDFTGCINGTNYELQTPIDDCAAVFRNF